MNNAGAIYVELSDHHRVAAAIERALLGRGFVRAALQPGAISGRIMIPEKRRRLFFVLPAQQGWVAVFEDPRYFGDRQLARELASSLATRVVWIEVSGNGVDWARGIYQGEAVLEEQYAEVETQFYGEHGIVSFVYDLERTPDQLIATLGLPHHDLHYEAIVAGELPAATGTPVHLAFERR